MTPHQFLEEVAPALDSHSDLSICGASAILVGFVGDQTVEIMTNGSMLMLLAPVRAPWFPQGASLLWAPEASYLRAKTLHDGESSVVVRTGNADFDSEYLLIGEQASQVLPRLSSGVQETLLSQVPLHLDLSRFDILAIGRSDVSPSRLSLKAAPDLRESPENIGPVPMGTQLFTPLNVAKWVRALSATAKLLSGEWQS